MISAKFGHIRAVSMGTKFTPNWKKKNQNRNTFLKHFEDFRKRLNKVYSTETSPGIFSLDCTFLKTVKSSFVARKEYTVGHEFFRIRDSINMVIESHKNNDNFLNLSNPEKKKNCLN